jgi:hypothetical protein
LTIAAVRLKNMPVLLVFAVVKEIFQRGTTVAKQPMRTELL